MGKLALTRRKDEQIHISVKQNGWDAERLYKTLCRDGITLTVTEIKPGQVRLHIEAPWGLRVDRAEWEDSDAFHASKETE